MTAEQYLNNSDYSCTFKVLERTEKEESHSVYYKGKSWFKGVKKHTAANWSGSMGSGLTIRNPSEHGWLTEFDFDFERVLLADAAKLKKQLPTLTENCGANTVQEPFSS